MANPANLTTLQEETRATIDGTEYVRLATSGANWKATLANIVSTLAPALSGGSGTQLQYRNGTAFGGISGSSWDSALLALVLAGASIAAASFRLTADTINAQTGTTYALTASDSGKIVTLDNANPITLTCPAGLGIAFSCLIVQLGAGQVSVVAGGGATLNSYLAASNLTGQYAMATIVCPTASSFVLGGQIS